MPTSRVARGMCVQTTHQARRGKSRQPAGRRLRETLCGDVFLSKYDPGILFLESFAVSSVSENLANAQHKKLRLNRTVNVYELWGTALNFNFEGRSYNFD